MDNTILYECIQCIGLFNKEKEHPRTPSWKLPGKFMLNLTTFLSLEEIVIAAQVCKHWYYNLCDPEIWKDKAFFINPFFQEKCNITATLIFELFSSYFTRVHIICPIKVEHRVTEIDSPTFQQPDNYTLVRCLDILKETNNHLEEFILDFLNFKDYNLLMKELCQEKESYKKFQTYQENIVMALVNVLKEQTKLKVFWMEHALFPQEPGLNILKSICLNCSHELEIFQITLFFDISPAETNEFQDQLSDILGHYSNLKEAHISDLNIKWEFSGVLTHLELTGNIQQLYFNEEERSKKYEIALNHLVTSYPDLKIKLNEVYFPPNDCLFNKTDIVVDIYPISYINCVNKLDVFHNCPLSTLEDNFFAFMNDLERNIEKYFYRYPRLDTITFIVAIGTAISLKQMIICNHLLYDMEFFSVEKFVINVKKSSDVLYLQFSDQTKNRKLLQYIPSKFQRLRKEKGNQSKINLEIKL